jgi:D-tyrosyl-tRNA(Tyr) deacylase
MDVAVSQFTLYGNVKKGSKPDFHDSMKSELARDLYATFLSKLKESYQPDKIQGTVLQLNLRFDESGIHENGY